MSRPSTFSQEIADKVCDLIADGKSLRQIEAMDGMPGTSTMVRWLQDDPEFRAQYAHAREIQAELLADELIEIADDGRNDWMTLESGNTVVDQEAIQRSKLRIDTRKWIASRLLPKKYGDKQQIEHSGDVTVIKAYRGIDPETDV